MLKKLEYKQTSDPIVLEYNNMAINSGLQAFSPKNNAIIQMDEIEERRARFLGETYKSQNYDNRGKNGIFSKTHFFSTKPYENENQGKTENSEIYGQESSFIDLNLNNQKISMDDFSIPMEFTKCQNLNFEENEEESFNNFFSKNRESEIFEDIGLEFRKSGIFNEKENKNWRGVEALNLDYKSLERESESEYEKERMIKSRYLSEIEKEKIKVFDYKSEKISKNGFQKHITKKTEISELKISNIIPKEESSNNIEINKIQEFKEENSIRENEDESECDFLKPRPSLTNESPLKTEYESFTQEGDYTNLNNFECLLRSPTRKIKEWTPNPYSPYGTCSENGLETKDFHSERFFSTNNYLHYGSKYIQDPLLFGPTKKILSFKDFLKKILKKNRGYINYELDLALKKFEETPIFKQRIVDFLNKKYLNNTTIGQKRIEWRQDEIKIMQNFYSKNRIEAFTDIKDFKEKNKNDRFMAILSTNVKDKSSVYSMMENRGKKVLVTIKNLPVDLKLVKSKVVNKRHLYRSPSKIATESRRYRNKGNNLDSEVICLMFLNKKKQFLHVFDILKRRTLNVFTMKNEMNNRLSECNDLPEIVDYDSNGEEVYVVTRRKIAVFSIFDFSLKKSFDLIDDPLSVFYVGYGRVMLIPRFGNLIEILNLEINTRKFIVIEKQFVGDKRNVRQGGKYFF